MEFLECKICQITYDEEFHRPRSALCGHELCSVCLRVLIKNGIFQCPKCRKTHKVNVPDDLPINFGLIDVIRAFKTKIVSLTKENEPNTSDVMRDEVCKVHHEEISLRCLKCEMWICFQCLDTHSDLIGCSTIRSSKAINNMKEKHTKHMNILLTVFREDANYISSKLQEHTKKRKELLASAQMHAKEEEKLCNLLEQGNIRKEKLIESINELKATTTTSPNVLMDRIEVLTHSKQSLRSWSLKKLGTDTLICLLKDADKEKGSYVEMVIKKEKKYAKLSIHEEMIYLHYFSAQKVDDCFSMPFDRLRRIIPEESSLVFLEMSTHNAKGRVLVRLHKDLLNIRENVIQIATGQQGITFAGITLESEYFGYMRAYNLPFRNIPVTPGSNKISRPKKGDIIGYFNGGYLSEIRFYFDHTHGLIDLGSGWCVFGTIEDGWDILLKCGNYSNGYKKISDCGIVIEYE